MTEQVKAFDLKDLGERLKNHAPSLGEEAVKAIATEVFGWAEYGCANHPNPMFKIGGMAIAAIKPEAFAAIDKIDGKVG